LRLDCGITLISSPSSHYGSAYTAAASYTAYL
jgi:hypothetical protein